MTIRIILSLIILLISHNSYALSPETRLTNDLEEQRAMKLFLEVRCLVCEGQVIESSNTEFSFEMRKLIRKKISEKKSDKEIKAELAKEFGEDILIEPSFKSGFLLWLLPIIFMMISFLLIRHFFK